MSVAFDPGSFKDPDGRVFHHAGRVFRTMTDRARARLQPLFAGGVVDELVERGWLLPCRLVRGDEAGLGGEDTVIEHARVPVVTYPYEWPFEMLRDGALLTLDILGRCLERDLMLKDATPYNLLWYEGRLRFVDTPSLERYDEGQPWDGYTQFCREFLFPLLLTARRGVEFHPLLRGMLRGLTATDTARLLGWSGALRAGVLRHVHLQAFLERSLGAGPVAVRREFKGARLSRRAIQANVRGLRRVLTSLRYRPQHAWLGYGAGSYSAADAARKRQFVEDGLRRLAPRQVVDLGSNTGQYSLLAADIAARVVSVDSDAASVNALYGVVRDRDIRNVVPVVGDLLNPAPGLGWLLEERRPLFERIGSDAFLALALVHHVCVTGNVPVDGFVAALRRLADGGIVEWVDKRDPMLQGMLVNRVDVFADYTWDAFRRALTERFELLEEASLCDGARRLCLVTRR
jgi:SAM-dependent methyltransferase